MYGHALATLAVCEAYALTGEPILETPARLGLDYIVRAQDPLEGGWGSTPGSTGNTSVTGWAVAALETGRLAGLFVPRATFQKVGRYLDRCASTDKGGYSDRPGGPETPAMTAVGLLCRQYLGMAPDDPGLQAGLRRLHAAGPRTTGNLEYEYHATQVMYHLGGDHWRTWYLGPQGDGRDGFRDHLIATADRGIRNPAHLGSWCGNKQVGGRLGATALALLSLEISDRYLPIDCDAGGRPGLQPVGRIGR
jgi:hypothetical protein